MFINFKKQNSKQKGSLLFEMLIVISLVAILISVGANAVFLSMRSNKASGERDTANGLASIALESVRSIAEENWLNIYGLTKSGQRYYPSEVDGKWVLIEGDEIININDISYTRYLTIDNVSRDLTTKDIESEYILGNDDPSTQKATVVVSWSQGSPVVISEYFYRWRNKICPQTEWTTPESGSNVENCNTISYDEKESTIDTSAGSLKLASAEVVDVAIGDSYGGGIVAYILQEGDPGYDPNVQHGLISAPSNQADGVEVPWGCYGTFLSGARGNLLGTGNQNTLDILAGCGESSIAARYCADLTLGGYSDWYLPSENELDKLYLNKDTIGGFVNYFWSSTQRDASDAMLQYFGNGNSFYSSKSNTAYVRAVRSF